MLSPIRQLVARGILVGLFLLAAQAASAEASTTRDTEDTQTGPYLGIGGVYAIENFSFNSDDLGLTSILGPNVDPNYDDSQGIEVLFGYRMTEHLAAEFQYEFLEGFDSTAGIKATEIDSHLLTANVKFYPVGGWLQPYLLAGIGVHIINSEVVRVRTVRKPFETDAGFVTRVGGGIDYYVTDHVVLEAEGSYMIGAGGIVQDAQFGALALHAIYKF